MSLIVLQDVYKSYFLAGGELEIPVLRGIHLTVEKGEYAVIMGPSGSGKSTLLNILGCLDVPTAGLYLLDGQDVSSLDDDMLSEIRCRRLGFIFQSYDLIAELSVLENITIPLYYQGQPEHESSRRAGELAAMVGLAERIGHKPTELSGGQQQRVAIARALANDPLVILADEPTGNLDTRTGEEILDILDKLHHAGRTLIVVTHDDKVAARAGRVIRMIDGRIVGDGA